MSFISPEFQERLREGKYTAWAVDLDEGTVEAMIWFVAEFAYRSLGQHEAETYEARSKTDNPYEHPRRDVALEALTGIVRGERFASRADIEQRLCKGEQDRMG